MTADLGEFLREAGSKRRSPSVWDCAAFPADWAVACGYPDPMVAFRGAYVTEAEAEGIIADAGGLCDLFDACLSIAGVPQVEGPPQAGDIGVLDVLGEQAGGIYTGKRWALVAERGLAFVSIEPAAVKGLWRVDNG